MKKNFGPLPALEVNCLSPVFDPHTGFGNNRASDRDTAAFAEPANDSVFAR